ncbi:hypothetical protein [Cumulibacter soli]|uniref:hypothetical protein n=1 Tax=Cumulibacter soli TaxID=2546344 RepID=UPI001068C30E|nr:hypothetical protein [Cumulibacter soli]
MSMPPQGPGGRPNHDPYGTGGTPQGWNQPQGGWDGAQAGGHPQDSHQQDPYQAPQTDPYQQQYDTYAAQNQDYQQSGYQTEQMPAAYDASLSAATMTGGSSPAGPGWEEPPRNNNTLPWIVGIAIIVVGAVVAVLLLVNSGDDDKSAGGGGSEQSQPAQSEGDQAEEDAQDGSGDGADSGADAGTDGGSNDGGAGDGGDTGGSGGSDDSGMDSLPEEVPVPASVTISSATYCSGSTCSGLFEADDPAAAYDEWVAALEDAGYTISSKDIIGSGDSAIWTIEAEGAYSLSLGWAGTGYLLVE